MGRVTREVLEWGKWFGGMRRVRNLIPLNSGFLGGTPPTSWTRSASGGTETAADSTVYGGHKAITFTIANQREILNQIVNVEINRKYRISFIVLRCLEAHLLIILLCWLLKQAEQ